MANQLISLFRYLTRLRGLPQPEAEVLARIAPAAGDQRMLDIGVGTGRTTQHFAPHFFEYVGIDSCEPLVQSCRKRYAKTLDTGHFEVCDVRSMQRFRDGTFDFILWRNGFDELDQDGRKRALNEIRRVTKKGGRFLISSVNIDETEFGAAAFGEVEVLGTYYLSTAI